MLNKKNNDISDVNLYLSILKGKVSRGRTKSSVVGCDRLRLPVKHQSTSSTGHSHDSQAKDVSGDGTSNASTVPGTS